MSEHQIVFIVDDDVAAAASVAALMTSIGYESRVYHSGEEFLEDSDGNVGGCLVLDIRLSGISGLEVLAELNRRQQPIPTILISGHADPESCKRALEMGAVACLEKPYTSKQLCDIVASVLT